MKSKSLTVFFLSLLMLSLISCTSNTPNGKDPALTANPSVPVHTTEPTEPSSEFLPLEVREFGYSVTQKGYLYIAAILHNPNTDYCIEFPSFRVAARDADGILLGSDEQVLSVIYPQQDFCYAGLMFEVEDNPATVDIEAIVPNDYNIVKPQNLDYPSYEPLAIINSVIREDRAMGEIHNSNDFDIDSAVVAIIYRDESGKIIGGDSTFVSNISASGNTPFDFSIHSGVPTDNYDIYANIW